MSMSRRTFFAQSAVLSLLSATFADAELAKAVATATIHPATPATAGEAYWSSLLWRWRTTEPRRVKIAK